EHRHSLDKLYSERAADDGKRFEGLREVNVTVKAADAPAKPISDMLVGIFFEDINYGADGGLYAELVQNRDFEYKPSDRTGDQKWNATRAWSTEGDGKMTILTEKPVHPNNLHYAHITADGAFTVANEGYDSIAVKKSESYRFSLMASAEKPCKVRVSLRDKNGKALTSKTINIKDNSWTTYKAVLKPSASCSDASLALHFEKGAEADIDMVSLFPAKTFLGRENGLRADLAQKLADIKPRFVRFPGGCVAHGDGIDNIYDWKGSIGPLEARKPLRNLWGYHQTRGLGYHEYFLFCEDIGAEPLPVLAAGVPCQNSGQAHSHSTCAIDTYGQQNGIAMEDMPAYIQDVLDLIEYANGPADSKWGALRAAAGHPEPFNMKYIGIGNEDMITEVFVPRFKMIYDAVRAAHPEITVIGTVGPFYEGTDYERGWQLARELEVPMVDEHYYVAPGWLIYNRDFYDSYPRGGTKVYLGEYASHLPGRPNNVETALSDALYLTDVERNGDVVAMTSYAPLLAKNGHTQWRPDMIYFDNTDVYPTPEYYVQRLYGNNSGDSYIPTELAIDSTDPKVKARIGVSVVADKAGRRYVKLVNMLPVPVKANLADLGIKGAKVSAEQLTGDPADESAKSAATSLSLPEATLPPYSFTVFSY
ncbi:MAG: carbohydrate binding domain-containing protein, partial [Muribaculaceae bacterium]|nr:carbohydrate binding domain-containing protein [Muribaculaceae bacterium]